MGFKTRNEQWSGYPREFRQLHTRASAPRVWTVQVQGNSVHTGWGQMGGAMQAAVEHFNGVNVGKKNEMSPEAYALDRAKEMCRKKHWEGYREYSNGVPLDEVVERLITFDDLPLSLCFYKPDNSMGAGITKKAENGEVWYSRKRNGLMYVIAKGKEKAKMYSRRMLRQHDDERGSKYTWDDRFDFIVNSVDSILPPNSIILGELVAVGPNYEDHFKWVQSVTKCLTPEFWPRFAQMSEQGIDLRFYCWDIAFWDGQDMVTDAPVEARYDLIHEFASRAVLPVEFFPEGCFRTPQEAVNFAKDRNWEGFVVVDPKGIYGDRAYNFKGKPDRPGKFCAKLKPEFEDDFIVYWDPDKGHGEVSTKGRYNNGIKSVALYQINSRGEMVYIANCASGMTEEMKRGLADPGLYPQVWQITYTDRRYTSKGDKTNAIDFPRFTSYRTDKTPAECVNEEL